MAGVGCVTMVKAVLWWDNQDESMVSIKLAV